MSANWKLAITVGLVTLAGTFAAQSAESADEALIRALPGAKITLLQGIAHVAKGTEVDNTVVLVAGDHIRAVGREGAIANPDTVAAPER